MLKRYGLERTGGRIARAAMAVLGVVAVCGAIASSAAAEPVRVTRSWRAGFIAPETPESLDRVGVVKVMPMSHRAALAADNVLVLEPGTSAGAPYFLPFAKWLVENVKGWQVWSVERRENRLENQSRLNMAKKGQITPANCSNTTSAISPTEANCRTCTRFPKNTRSPTARASGA